MTLGKVAYEAYCSGSERMQSWETLSDDEKEKWEAAARATRKYTLYPQLVACLDKNYNVSFQSDESFYVLRVNGMSKTLNKPYCHELPDLAERDWSIFLFEMSEIIL